MTTNTHIHCNGINHSDSGKSSKCKRCGRPVARRDDGKTFDVRTYHTRGGYERTTYACYAPTHRCDAHEVKVYQEAIARDLAEGKLIPGQVVIVARGRKIPKGIIGKITWTGESDFGPRARVQPDLGEAFFIPLKNLDIA